MKGQNSTKNDEVIWEAAIIHGTQEIGDIEVSVEQTPLAGGPKPQREDTSAANAALRAWGSRPWGDGNGGIRTISPHG